MLIHSSAIALTLFMPVRAIAFFGNIMSDRSRTIQLPGRVYEIVGFWRILLVNPPLIS
ncbi:hypothetical protein [Microcoleus sp. herbarium14]|uniref:hypothetical protein n=1 Tax=Microcoleus sp. herbarium14 TaxID=3055439 RepID=UPI002FD6507A